MASDDHRNADLQTKEYWDTRYAAEEEGATFDWFKKYDQIKDVFAELIPDKGSSVLMLGCGNSTLSEDMYADGYRNIVNVDYSSVVISRMRSRHPQMEWIEADVRDMSMFKKGSFDVAIDKGTLDALVATDGSVWDPPADVVENARREIDEVIRVLTPTGTFIYLTFGQPHFRKPFLVRQGPEAEAEADGAVGWRLEETRTLGDAWHYYLYVCRKGQR